MSPPRPRVGVSACLLGQKVRYDGQHKRDEWLVDVLGEHVEFVPVCPEVELGLGVPRPTIRLVGPARPPRLVSEQGQDLTDAMERWVGERVEALAALDLSGWVLKKDSPSCGMERVRVHAARGGGPPRREGVGLFARGLMERLPLLPVEEEGRLRDAALREAFVERLFAFARWKAALAAGMTRGALVRFHTAHELALLAHSPAGYRRLGALVGASARGPFSRVVEEYGRGLMEALRVPATRGRHVDVLERVLGYFERSLPAAERRELEGLVRDYQRALVPLVVPLTLLRHHARRAGVGWLLEQVYLSPEPRELLLRNHV